MIYRTKRYLFKPATRGHMQDESYPEFLYGLLSSPKRNSLICYKMKVTVNPTIYSDIFFMLRLLCCKRDSIRLIIKKYSPHS
jgi:hypothetical protein